MITEAGKSKICRVGPQAGAPKQLQFRSKGHFPRNSLFRRGGQVFVLFRPSTDWMRPLRIKGNLLYSESTDFNVHLI